MHNFKQYENEEFVEDEQVGEEKRPYRGRGARGSLRRGRGPRGSRASRGTGRGRGTMRRTSPDYDGFNGDEKTGNDESVTLVSAGGKVHPQHYETREKLPKEQSTEKEAACDDNPQEEKPDVEKLYDDYDKSKPTLVVSNIPPELNNLDKLYDHFKQYGKVVNIMVGYRGSTTTTTHLQLLD